MTALLSAALAWATWCLLDRRLPPLRLVALAPSDTARRPRPGRRRPEGVRPERAAPGRRRSSWPGGGRSAVPPPDLATVVDLLAVAVTAGYSLHGAVRLAGREATGPLGHALTQVSAAFDRGVPLVDGLVRLPRVLGPGVAPLSTTLAVAAAAGTPLGPALQRLADAERLRARRAAEARARRLPVLLLGPLVGLILPAFVVLTLVPAALSSVGGAAPSAGLLPPSSGPARAGAAGP
ncbi:MAG: type II secretion system F family protein [Actinomycetes bacterium]